jgi:hypothetical protein
MWQSHVEAMNGPSVLRLSMTSEAVKPSFREVLKLWKDDEQFRDSFVRVLADAPLSAYRWECPPLTAANADRMFECVLLRCDGLDRRPDIHAFAEFYSKDGSDSVVGFPSLGRDAYLIAPCPIADSNVYPHLAAFLRGAPRQQIHALWQCIGKEVESRLSDRPLWLSTAGMGVAWLHVRLDSRPKYYGHRPYTGVP